MIYEDKKFTEETLSGTISKFFDISSDCYVIGDSVMDGQILKFKTALRNTVEDCGLNCLLCGDDLLLIKEEASLGAPYVCIYVRK